MTAEIAILNKSAIALATDSAVTITSAGSQKVFDSADKLFELSCSQPIGIMIYNGMQFAGIPLPDLIKEFRASAQEFETVEEAAKSFLQFLHGIGEESPPSVRHEILERIVSPILSQVEGRVYRLFQEVSEEKDDPIKNGIESFIAEIHKRAIREISSGTEKLEPGQFLGDGSVEISKNEKDFIGVLISERFPSLSHDLIIELRDVCGRLMESNLLSDALTGLIVAGFGENERFPTLISYEIEGPILGRLKFRETSRCDIDRNGEKAFIRPFAQREMVERFLYGLDEEIQREIHEFCRCTVGSVSDEILSSLVFEDEAAKEDLADRTKNAESKFLLNLKDRAFKVIEERSRRAVEDMIQFMPKPELARMAEALVELTSMKRKVTLGVETVGGPVDVAVISKAEGFVWIKRKHYFPPELNVRYLDRVRANRMKQED